MALLWRDAIVNGGRPQPEAPVQHRGLYWTMSRLTITSKICWKLAIRSILTVTIPSVRFRRSLKTGSGS
jgi:hypothetical protein